VTDGSDRLRSLTGARADSLASRLGEPATVRISEFGEWRIYDLDDGSLRLRLSRSEPEGAEAEGRVAGWTLTLSVPADTLREAAEPLGLWPDAAPDERADGFRMPLIRRSLPTTGAHGAGEHTLTATVRYGVITQVSVFDEAPDWY
jgi:hypothetical protein